MSDFDSHTVDGRLRSLLQKLTGGTSGWKSLEHMTGVAAEKWRNFHRGQTKASIELIESIARVLPEYAFWLLAGITDEEHGHISPDLAWPNSIGKRQREQAAKLFLTLIEMTKHSEKEGFHAELVEKEAYLRRLREAEEKLLSQFELKDQEKLQG